MCVWLCVCLKCGIIEVCFQGQVDIGPELGNCTISKSELITSSCVEERRGFAFKVPLLDHCRTYNTVYICKEKLFPSQTFKNNSSSSPTEHNSPQQSISC